MKLLYYYYRSDTSWNLFKKRIRCQATAGSILLISFRLEKTVISTLDHFYLGVCYSLITNNGIFFQNVPYLYEIGHFKEEYFVVILRYVFFFVFFFVFCCFFFFFFLLFFFFLNIQFTVGTHKKHFHNI